MIGHAVVWVCVQEDTLQRCNEASAECAVEFMPHGPVPPLWPQHGHILFRNVCLRYGGSAALALDGLCLEIQPGRKVGICGRTGALLWAPQTPVRYLCLRTLRWVPAGCPC